MDREKLISRLLTLGIPYTEEDLEGLLAQYQGYLNAFGQFPELDPSGDEPVLIFRPEVPDDDR